VTRQEKAAAKRTRRALRKGCSSYAWDNEVARIAAPSSRSLWSWPSNPYHREKKATSFDAAPAASRKSRLMASLAALIARGKGAR
jgi:hypothetical protein